MKPVTSAFQHGGEIPVRFTCEGDNISPDFSWELAPANAKSFALIIHDPDAPRAGGFTHWIVYRNPGNLRHLEENLFTQANAAGQALQGKNDYGEIGYAGPCPPRGRHRYIVKLFALDAELDLKPGATREQLMAASEGHCLAEAELMGTYIKKAEQIA